MIILDTSNRSLEMVLSGAVTTNELPFVVSYVAIDVSDMTMSAVSSNNGESNGTTDKTIVSAPNSGSRQVKTVTVYNKDTVEAEVTIQVDDGGTNREIIKRKLQVGETLQFVDGHGWSVVPEKKNRILSGNSSTTAITAAGTFVGSWTDVTDYDSIVIAAKTDQDGYMEVQFSPDGTNEDSSLKRYYRTAQIEVPHRFTITRQYTRVKFVNTSASNQTYLRLQTTIGDKTDLNAPCDSTLAQDFDATVVRPTSYNTEVALGRRQGHVLWNKFGYNEDVDIGTEVVASWGGTFTPITTASVLSIVSTDAADDGAPAGTGCNSVVIYGLDANRDEVTEVVTLNGTTPVVTTSTWLGVNRVAMFLCGTGKVNAGVITVTETAGGSTMAQMPIGGGVTQQCIFYVPRNHNFIMEWLYANSLRQSGADPKVTIKIWVYSTANNGNQEVFRGSMDTSVSTEIDINPQLPFPVTESSVVWMEATTDKNDTIISGRFSGILVRDADA